MSPEEFTALFGRFSHDVFRLECWQNYAVSDEDASLRAFREGTPRPERSVRTSPYLRQVAVTTADGKSWQRVRIVEHPLTEYLQWELLAYVESQAAGEEILIADRGAAPELATVGPPDFWLFDSQAPAGAEAFAVLLHYDEHGQLLEREYTTDRQVLARCRHRREVAIAHAVPLNTYLAAARPVSFVA